jgi:hypothetical protein
MMNNKIMTIFIISVMAILEVIGAYILLSIPEVWQIIPMTLFILTAIIFNFIFIICIKSS